MATKDYSGKIAYIYDQETSTWYAVSGVINTAAAYNWLGTNTYENTVIFQDVVRAQAGINNFLNPAARDLALPLPVAGLTCFVRQNAAGTPINQLQYYYNGVWRQIGDATDLLSSATNYTLVITDANKLVMQTGSATNTVTIPRSLSVNFLIGQRIDIAQMGTGSTTIVADTGVIINSADSKKRLGRQYSAVSVIKVATDTWLLVGDLTT